MWLIILLIVLAIVAIIKITPKATSTDDVSPSVIKIETTSPHPEKTNDYKFHKFIAIKSEFIIEQYYKMIKNKGFHLKPDYEKAIQEKLLKGSYKNPIDFKTYFGNRFEYMTVSFSSLFYESEISYYIDACYIKNNTIATTESFITNPPPSIFHIDDDSQTVLPWDLEQGNDILDLTKWKLQNNNDLGPLILSFDANFKETWNCLFELKDCFESNLLIFWNNDFKVFIRTLIHNNIAAFNFEYIILREIAEGERLPTTIEGLLAYYKIDKSKDFTENLAHIYTEFEESIHDLSRYKHRISNP
ncbi:MAG: hypothetical protein Q4G63_08655 [Bacteroidia bacterium]|nr:hypothetical protein [Bacteroidia bacterium]